MSKDQKHLFTEEEAADKLCALTGQPCVASDCMKWRFAIASHTAAFSNMAIEKAKAEDIKYGKAFSDLLKEEAHLDLDYTEGYCGAGGDPKLPLRT